MGFLKHIWHDFRTDPLSRWLSLATLAVNVGQWALFGSVVPRGDQFLPLHYTIYFGIDLTGHWTRAFWLPTLGTAIWIVHLLLSDLVREATWRRAWWVIGLVANTTLLLGAFSIAWIMRNRL